MTTKQEMVERIAKIFQSEYSDYFSARYDIVADFVLQAQREAVEEARIEAFEEWCRWAVRRMSYWKTDDNKKSFQYRKGVEQVCSEMCCYFRGRTSDEGSPYLERQAIEHAMEKCGMKWENNRTRLSFYECFEDYIKNKINGVISRASKYLGESK